MKQKGLVYATIVFFLLLNTTYYWEGKMGLFAMVTFLLLILYFLILMVLFLEQVYFAAKEKFKNIQRLFLIGIMVIVLSLSFLYPNGIIDFSKFENESIFIAQREGAANCMTTLRLRDDNTFHEWNVCFGVTETKGTYHVKGDTIYFERVSHSRQDSKFYKFAIIKYPETNSEKNLGILVRFKDNSDASGTPLWIIKNELIK